MSYSLCYNEYGYMKSILVGERIMSLDSLLAKYNYTSHAPCYRLTGKTDKYLGYIYKAPFFISPDLSLIKESLSNRS